jgi:hypothetical protein
MEAKLHVAASAKVAAEADAAALCRLDDVEVISTALRLSMDGLAVRVAHAHARLDGIVTYTSQTSDA